MFRFSKLVKLHHFQLREPAFNMCQANLFKTRFSYCLLVTKHVFPLFLLLFIYCSCVSAENSIATTTKGQIKGTIGHDLDGKPFFEFFGIPYAKPPIRFRPAESGESWQGVRDASKVPQPCISRDDFNWEIVGGEDCLYLNVYTKSLPSSNYTSLKPVMVFIHGGGLTLGSSRPRIYGPEFLMIKDIVLVTFNYRLGALGFLSSSDPNLQLPGNLGLKDQNLALKWIRENIKSFNGDPNKVTIFGNSAGASSVHAHILSAASRGLFQRAILQSGSALNPWFWGSKDNLIELAEKAGKKPRSDAEALSLLKTLSAEEILLAQEKIYDSPFPADRRPFSAVQEIPNDSMFLNGNPVDIIKSGNYNQVTIMMGYTDSEGMLLDWDRKGFEAIGSKLPDLNIEQLVPVDLQVPKNSNDYKEIVNALAKLYPKEILENSYNPMTDAYFLVEIVEALKQHLQTTIKPVYVYRITLTGELNQLKKLLNKTQEPGVAHSDELGYLFRSDLTPTKLSASQREDIKKFVDLWTNFATHENSTFVNNKWKPVKNANRIRHLDIGKSLRLKSDIPERDRLEVWWSFMEKWPLAKFS